MTKETWGGTRNSECWAGHGGGSGGISPDGGTLFIGDGGTVLIGDGGSIGISDGGSAFMSEGTRD